MNFGFPPAAPTFYFQDSHSYVEEGIANFTSMLDSLPEKISTLIDSITKCAQEVFESIEIFFAIIISFMTNSIDETLDNINFDDLGDFYSDFTKEMEAQIVRFNWSAFTELVEESPISEEHQIDIQKLLHLGNTPAQDSIDKAQQLFTSLFNGSKGLSKLWNKEFSTLSPILVLNHIFSSEERLAQFTTIIENASSETDSPEKEAAVKALKEFVPILNNLSKDNYSALKGFAQTFNIANPHNLPIPNEKRSNSNDFFSFSTEEDNSHEKWLPFLNALLKKEEVTSTKERELTPKELKERFEKLPIHKKLHQNLLKIIPDLLTSGVAVILWKHGKLLLSLQSELDKSSILKVLFIVLNDDQKIKVGNEELTPIETLSALYNANDKKRDPAEGRWTLSLEILGEQLIKESKKEGFAQDVQGFYEAFGFSEDQQTLLNKTICQDGVFSRDQKDWERFLTIFAALVTNSGIPF